MHTTRQAAFVLALALVAAGAAAHEKAHGPAKPARAAAAPVQQPWGIAGEAKAVRRTIDVVMTDRMRFEPDRIEVRLGETVRFRVRNAGRMLHEFVIGTRESNAEHAELMIKFPAMEHDEPYMAHVDPGKTGQLVWRFNREGEFEFACLIAGHYQAGMKGTLRVVSPAR